MVWFWVKLCHLVGLWQLKRLLWARLHLLPSSQLIWPDTQHGHHAMHYGRWKPCIECGWVTKNVHEQTYLEWYPVIRSEVQFFRKFQIQCWKFHEWRNVTLNPVLTTKWDIPCHITVIFTEVDLLNNTDVQLRVKILTKGCWPLTSLQKSWDMKTLSL